jgi:tetratricopeptide (TPR) repeat protein
VLSLAVGVGTFVVYAATAARSVWWGDSAELVSVAKTLGIAHPPGYPLYTLLSAVIVRIPAGSPFFRLSLFSAAAGAAAAAVTALIAWRLTGPPWGRTDGDLPLTARAVGSASAGFALGLSSTLWSQSTVPEVYALSACLVLSVLLLILVWLAAGAWRPGERGPRPAPPGGLGDRALPLAALLLGLALAHHLTAILIVPSVLIALFARTRRPGAARVGGAVALLATALLLYAYLPVRSAQDPAVLWDRIDSWSALAAHVSGAQYASRLFAGPPWLAVRKLAQFVGQLPSEVPWPILAGAAVGCVVLWRRSKAVFAILVLEAVLVVVHAANYRIPDVRNYYIPAHAVLCTFAGIGAAHVAGAGRLRAAGRSALVAAVIAVVAAPLFVRARDHWPDRDLSRRTGAEVYARRLLESAGPGLVLAQNDRTVFLLWHERFVRGRRPDLAIIDVRGRAPHLERWFPGVRFPTEEELARYLGRSADHPCDPPAREVFPVGAYAPLLVALNRDSLAVYADVDLAMGAFPERSLPSGLLARISADSVATIPRELVERAITMTDGDRFGAGVVLDRPTAQAYAKVIGDFGELFLVRGEVEDAVRALERSRDLAPEVPQAHNNLGVAYLRAGRFEEGVREIGRALELDPGLAAAHYGLYGLLVGMDELDRAAGELEAAARLDRENTRYRLELASLYERLERPDDAERVYRALERSDPLNMSVPLAYGDFLSRRRRYSEAVAAFGRAEELSPGSPGILCNLGRCYWELADAERAIEAMRRSSELQPHNARLKYDLAEMLHCAGEPAEAIVHLNDAIRVLPDMWEARALKATILAEGGSFPEARRLFEQAWELGADEPSFWGAWSAMENAAGDTLRAREVAQGLE